MNVKLGRLPVLAAAIVFAAAVTPHLAAAATVQLFPANDVSTTAGGTVFGTRTLLMQCGGKGVTTISSPGNATGVVVDNYLLHSVRRIFSSKLVVNHQSLCGNGNGAPPSGGTTPPSCFSGASGVTDGKSASSVYTGIGTITVPNTPGLALHVFQLVNAGTAANPQANNQLQLQTNCRIDDLSLAGGSLGGSTGGVGGSSDGDGVGGGPGDGRGGGQGGGQGGGAGGHPPARQ